jgi:hypothetical protein
MARIYSKRIKQNVCNLRSKGWSLGEISLKMRIPKNTISGWVRDIRLTEAQRNRIKKKIISSGAIGRPLAAELLREKMEKWKEGIRAKVKHFKKLPMQHPEIEKVICGLLYLCEGAKYPSTRYLKLANSDPNVICFFINTLRKHFHINERKLRISVGYRYDQNLKKLIDFWSNLTKIPKTQFLNSKPDIRTRKSETLRKDYRGICKIIYYDTSLQFELQSIGEIIIKNGAYWIKLEPVSSKHR